MFVNNNLMFHIKILNFDIKYGHEDTCYADCDAVKMDLPAGSHCHKCKSEVHEK